MSVPQAVPLDPVPDVPELQIEAAQLVRGGEHPDHPTSPERRDPPLTF